MKFGEYLKSQRDARGWTQPMAAEKIGIEQSYLSKLETGKASPSEEMFERLVMAYDIDVDAMADSVSLGELERLREIAAIRDLVRRGQQATARGRRRWLVASLLLIALGGALLSFVITERRYADSELEYLTATWAMPWPSPCCSSASAACSWRAAGRTIGGRKKGANRPQFLRPSPGF